MSDTSTSAPAVAAIPAATQYLVPIRDVERELNKQMKALQGAGAAPVQRARMSNLVIFCGSLEQSILLNEQVPAISVMHPARVLLLVGETNLPDRELTARVTVRPLGEGAKQLRLRRTGDAARRRAQRRSAAVRGAGAADRRPTGEPAVGCSNASAVVRARCCTS